MPEVYFSHKLGDQVLFKYNNKAFLGTITEIIKNNKGEYYLIERVANGAPIYTNSESILKNMTEVYKSMLESLITNGEVRIEIKL